MKELKETLENTLINNLEVHHMHDAPTYDSIQTCADYISKEIVDLMVEFAKETSGTSFRIMLPEAQQDFATRFLRQRFKNKA